MDENYKIKAALIVAGLPPGEYSSLDMHEIVSQRMQFPYALGSGQWIHIITMLTKQGILETTKKHAFTGKMYYYTRGGRKKEQFTASGKSGKPYPRPTGKIEAYKRKCKVYIRTDKDLVLPERVKEEAIKELCERTGSITYIG